MKRVERRADEGGGRVTALELFYDLVFVFAITQITHLLVDNLSWAGVGQASVVLLVVWWSWNYTTWVTNELDPESAVTRLLLIILMLGSLLMAIAIPEAFGDKALLFAGTYVAMQVGRHTFLTFAAARSGTTERERAGRILVWFVAAGVFWISGALVEGSARTILWVVALAVDYTAPFVLYWVPGRRRLGGETWQVGTEHFAERFQLFVIVALGESIVVTGATTSDLDLTRPTLLAFVVAFLSSASLWWLYFNIVARIVQQHSRSCSGSHDAPADVYTYLHVFIVRNHRLGGRRRVGDRTSGRNASPSRAHRGSRWSGPLSIGSRGASAEMTRTKIGRKNVSPERWRASPFDSLPLRVGSCFEASSARRLVAVIVAEQLAGHSPRRPRRSLPARGASSLRRSSAPLDPLSLRPSRPSLRVDPNRRADRPRHLSAARC